MMLKKEQNTVLKFLLYLLFFDVLIVFTLEQFFMHSFSFIPFYRIGVIIFSFCFFIPHFLYTKISLKEKITNEFLIVILWSIFTIFEFFHGVLRFNPKIYVTADFVYIMFGLFLFLLITKSPTIKVSYNFSFFLFKFLISIVLFLIFDVTISEVFFLILLTLLYYYFNQKKYLISLLLLVVFIYQTANSNRALLVCFVTIFSFIGIEKIKNVVNKIDLLIILTIVFVLLLSFYQELILGLQSLVPEGSQMYYRIDQLSKILSKGIDYNNPYHTSIAQRIIEVKLVVSSWTNSIWSFLFGEGLGAVINGDLLIDPSVKKTALLGSSTIHNIHILPFSFIHKYGLLGLSMFVFLVIDFFNSVKRIIERNSLFVFWDLLFVLIFIYAIPAASFLWTTPVFWIAFGMKSIKSKVADE